MLEKKYTSKENQTNFKLWLSFTKIYSAQDAFKFFVELQVLKFHCKSDYMNKKKNVM